MKKIVVVALMAFVSVVNADSIHWEKSAHAAIMKGKKLHRPVMVVVNKDGCRWCERFAATTLRDQAVVKEVNRNFIAFRGHVNRNEIPYRLQTSGTPSTWFLKDGEPMFQPLAGAYPATQFLEALEIVKKEYAKPSSK